MTRDFYLRQLRDWKGSFEVEGAIPPGLTKYVGVCAQAPARAHARSGDRVAIASYLGNGPTFERALAEFAETYADQTNGTTTRSDMLRPLGGSRLSRVSRPAPDPHH